MSRTRLKIGSDFQASRIPWAGRGLEEREQPADLAQGVGRIRTHRERDPSRGPEQVREHRDVVVCGVLDSSAGPAARSVRSHTSVISRYGSMGLVMRLSSPAAPGPRGTSGDRRTSSRGRPSGIGDRSTRGEEGAGSSVLRHEPGPRRRLKGRTPRPPGVVGRPFPFASVPIDAARRAAMREPARCQDQIDPQPPVASERRSPVVPPRERALGLIEQAEGVGETERGDRSERIAFRAAAQDRIFHSSGSCTSRSSGAMLKSPATTVCS